VDINLGNARHVFLVLMFFFLVFQSKGQNSFTTEVWNRFHDLTQQTTHNQIEGFQILREEFVQKGITTDSTYTNLLFLYAAAHFKNSDVEKGIALLKHAIDIGFKYPDRTPTAYMSKYYFYLGYFQMKTDSTHLALANFKKAYEFGIKERNKWKIPAMACYMLAHLYFDIQDYEHGLFYSSLGINLSIKDDDYLNLTRNLYEQIINLNELNRINDKDSKIDSLLVLANIYEPENERGIYYKLAGDINARGKKYSNAKKHLLEAAYIYKKNDLSTELGDIYVDLHYLAVLMDDSSSMNLYRKLALKYNSNTYNLSRLFYNISLSYKNVHLYDKVLYSLQKSLTTLPIKFYSSSILKNPTANQIKNLSQKDYAFTPLLDKAEILSLDTNNKTNLQYALNTYQLLDTLVDYIRWQHQGMATKLFWREKLTNLYEQATETAYQLNDTEKVFYFLEKSRAVLLLDQLNSNAAKNFLPQAEADKEAVLRMQISYYQNKGDPNEQLSDFLQAQAKLDEYVKDLEKRYPRYYEYKYNNHVPRLTEVQDYLAKSQQSLLSYYEGKQGVYLLVVTPEKSLLKKLDSASYYSKKQELMSFFAHANQVNQQYDNYLQTSNRFYQLFLAPLKHHLTQRVIVSTSGAIIPFAALSASAQKADYLVNHYAFSYTYSARALLNQQVHPSADKTPNYFLGVAPVNYPYKSTLAALPTSRKALKDNQKLFQSTLLFTNEKANKASFEIQWPQAKVVQLISHAYADQENTQPLIYFADSSLSLNDIHQEQTQTQLLVLSACRTGIGKDYQGEGVFSLSRGFMGAGVPSIYSTLWDVADQVAYALSHQVLKSASKEVPLDLALQKAQIDWLRKADRSKQIPNAWAGIILLGSSNPLPPEPFSYYWIFYLLGTCLLLAFACWWWLKSVKKVNQSSNPINS